MPPGRGVSFPFVLTLVELFLMPLDEKLGAQNKLWHIVSQLNEAGVGVRDDANWEIDVPGCVPRNTGITEQRVAGPKT